jgi:hypothetical protein
MAFPQVVNITSALVTTNLTSHVVTMPSGSGGRVLVFFHKDGTDVPTHDGSGWTDIISQTTCVARAYLLAIYKDSSAESSLTFTTASEMCSWIAVRISGADSATAPAVAVSDNTHNPPSLDPAAWASEDTLWIAGHGGDPAWSYTSAAPANYTTNYTETGNISASNDGVSLALGFRELAASSDDPGVWTAGAESDFVSFTVAIRPGTAETWPPGDTPAAPPLRLARSNLRLG